jgi:hypothetical protein
MKNIFLLIIATFFCGMNLFAQDDPWADKDTTPQAPTSTFWHSRENWSKSFWVGGMKFKKDALYCLKGGYEYKHWGGSVDIFYRTHKEERQEFGTNDYYRSLGFSVNGRYYVSQIARNIFAEIGAGTSTPSLKTTKKDAPTRVVRTKVQYITWGAGWRFGMKPRGLFGEIGYKGYLPLQTVLLYTSDSLPANLFDQMYSTNGLYIKQFQVTNTLYGGLGWSF